MLLFLLLVNVVLGDACDPSATEFSSTCIFDGDWTIADAEVRFFLNANVTVKGNLFVNRSLLSMEAIPNAGVPFVQVLGVFHIGDECSFTWVISDRDISFLEGWSRNIPAIKTKNAIDGTFSSLNVNVRGSIDACVHLTSNPLYSAEGFLDIVRVDKSSCKEPISFIFYLLLAAVFALLVFMIYTVIKCIRSRREREVAKPIQFVPEDDFFDDE